MIQWTISAEQTGATRTFDNLGWHLLTNIAFEHFVVDSGNVLSIFNANDFLHWDAGLVIWVVFLMLFAKLYKFLNSSFLENLFTAFVIFKFDIFARLAKDTEDTFALDKSICC